MNFDDDDFAQDNNPFAGSINEGLLDSQVWGKPPIVVPQPKPDQADQFQAIDSASTNHASNDDDNTKVTAADTTTETVKIELTTEMTPPAPTITSHEMLRDIRNFRTVYYSISVPGTNEAVLRRYSDFVSLRSYLVKFFQTKVIPPTPEKHSLGRLLRHPFDYKSDEQIIERRTHLLNYFLERLWENAEIRCSEFFTQFMDPQNKHWSKLLNGHPFNTLSSHSILLTSPRDPTAPNAYFAFLPTPPKGLLRDYHSELNDTVFKPLESKVRKVLHAVRKLENTVNTLTKDFDGERQAMAELGGFFNIFSIVEDDHQVIEHFGNKIDLNFLNVETLSSSLTVHVKEKLMIVRLTMVSILQLLHFRKMKELQLSYLQDTIMKKQARLKSITERILVEKRLDQMIHSGNIESPTLNRAIDHLRGQRSASERLDLITASMVPDTEDEINNDIQYTSSVSRKAVSKMTESELQSELVKMSQELDRKLIPCFRSLTEDVEYISVNVENNVNAEMNRMVRMIGKITVDWNQQVFGEYVRSNMEVWEGDLHESPREIF